MRRLGFLTTLSAGVIAVSAAFLTVPSAEAAPALPPFGSGVGTTSDDGAVVTSETWLDDRTVDIRIATPSVPGTNWPVRLLLPKGWQYLSFKTWPVALMFHGGEDDYTSWTRETDIEALSSTWNTIVAMPDAGYGATYTNYFNGGKGGPPKWETFHTQELLQILERGYHASKVRSAAGISGGGYGAMIYSAHNPGLFKYAASYSGSVALRAPGVRWFRYIAAQDPDPAKRFGVPYLNESNWKYWDPIDQAEKLRGTGLYISSGLTGVPRPEDTVGWTPIQFLEVASGSVNKDFDKRLTQLKIPHTSSFYPLGEHDWVSWQIEMHKSWPLMMQAIGATQG